MTKHIVTAHLVHEETGREVVVSDETEAGGFAAVDVAIAKLINREYFEGRFITERHVLDEWRLLTLVAMRVEL